jgi:hypothetical protein
MSKYTKIQLIIKSVCLRLLKNNGNQQLYPNDHNGFVCWNSRATFRSAQSLKSLGQEIFRPQRERRRRKKNKNARSGPFETAFPIRPLNWLHQFPPHQLNAPRVLRETADGLGRVLRRNEQADSDKRSTKKKPTQKAATFYCLFTFR